MRFHLHSLKLSGYVLQLYVNTKPMLSIFPMILTAAMLHFKMAANCKMCVLKHVIKMYTTSCFTYLIGANDWQVQQDWSWSSMNIILRFYAICFANYTPFALEILYCFTFLLSFGWFSIGIIRCLIQITCFQLLHNSVLLFHDYYYKVNAWPWGV